MNILVFFTSNSVPLNDKHFHVTVDDVSNVDQFSVHSVLTFVSLKYKDIFPPGEL